MEKEKGRQCVRNIYNEWTDSTCIKQTCESVEGIKRKETILGKIIKKQKEKRNILKKKILWTQIISTAKTNKRQQFDDIHRELGLLDSELIGPKDRGKPNQKLNYNR